MKEVRVVSFDYIREECVDKWLEIAKTFIKATHEKDEGCIEFYMLQQDKNPGIFCYVETWASLDAMNRHMEQEHFKKFAEERAKMYIKPTEWTTYTYIEG